MFLHQAHADENTVQFRTVSARMKPPQRFYVTYGELDRLREDKSIITNETSEQKSRFMGYEYAEITTQRKLEAVPAPAAI